MSISKNLRIMITCVDIDIEKVLIPIRYLEPDRVYLFYHNKKATKEEKESLVQLAQKLLEHKNNFIRTGAQTNHFNNVLSEILRIIRDEKDGNKIYVNVGAGTHIFTAASLIASLMENVKPVFIPDNYNLSEEVDISIVPPFQIIPPNQKMIDGLITLIDSDPFSEANNNELEIRIETRDLVEKMYKKRIIPEPGKQVKNEYQSKLMWYRRNLLYRWLGEGWIKRGKKSIIITDMGRTMYNIYKEIV